MAGASAICDLPRSTSDIRSTHGTTVPPRYAHYRHFISPWIWTLAHTPPNKNKGWVDAMMGCHASARS
jgi:hypothetical protein